MSRMLALSDGVFAIALTLLVISLLPGAEVTPDNLVDTLRDLEPQIFAYALSVLVIGAFWMAHRRVFSWIETVDGGLLMINIVFLGIVALIPFPTDLMGRFGEETAALVIYAAVIAVAALGSWALFTYAAHRQLLKPTTPARVGLESVARALSISTAFVVSIPVAFWSPTAAPYVWIAALPLRYAAFSIIRRHERGSLGGAVSGGQT
jgi:uncharacterized membrane protein